MILPDVYMEALASWMA